jgi:hypothetical protein
VSSASLSGKGTPPEKRYANIVENGKRKKNVSRSDERR